MATQSQRLENATQTNSSLTIYTDGGCSPNPGPGGWGFVVVSNGEAIAEACGGEMHTTNNRMELTAIVRALEFCRNRTSKDDAGPSSTIELFSDSNLCVQTYNTWMAGWKRRGWKRSRGAVENLDLIKQLDILKQSCPFVTVNWIKAHIGVKWNEYADQLTHQGRLMRRSQNSQESV